MRRSPQLLKNPGVFLRPRIKKIGCATHRHKTSRISTRDQKHLRVGNLGRCPQLLKNSFFSSSTFVKFYYASNKPETCRICYRHRKHYKTYGLSCLKQLWKIDLSSNPQRGKFALHRTRLKLTEYATDTERSLENRQ